jgi:hypothetical protein
LTPPPAGDYDVIVSKTVQRFRARDLGTGVFLLLAMAVLVLICGERAGCWEERRLVLATVGDASELEIGSPVYFRGVEIGEVVKIGPPEEEMPGFKIRMAVDKTAFKHIPLDSPVRLDPGKMNLPVRVTILPGREKPDRDFPGKVKVLREVSDEENAVRLIRDVLDGLEDLSKAKATEVEMMELREEIGKLRKELQKMEGKGENE